MTVLAITPEPIEAEEVLARHEARVTRLRAKIVVRTLGAAGLCLGDLDTTHRSMLADATHGYISSDLFWRVLHTVVDVNA